MLKKVGIFVFVVLIGVAVLAVVNVLFFRESAPQAIAPTDSDGGSEPSAEASVLPDSDATETLEAIIVYDDSGFIPSIFTVKTGTLVTFKNISSRPFWPASASHPTHAVYNGTPLDENCREGFGGMGIFDSCGEVPPREGWWSFRLDKVGTWKYHDHLNASRTGTIVVE